MAKGSQLSQLKSALSNAGITKPPENKKKRKRAQNEEKERAKRAERLKDIQSKLNPFDVKVTKLKHDVGGRKLKGITGKPAQSKQAGMEQRKKTLLQEVAERGRVGGIVDRRFGENDPTMTPEERMLERFTREKQRASRGTAFNLDDEDELTHYGQSLSKLDDFDNAGLTLDDEDEDARGQIDGSTVGRGHFGGFDDDEEGSEPDRKKSKAEVMAEVIAKSKEHKIQRQEQKLADDDVRHQLDQELDSIRSLLLKPDPVSESLVKSNDGLNTGKAAEKDQEYDQFIRELVFDKRARPKDRLKTEEELALEEKQKLEKEERRRIRRMNGQEDGSSSEDEGRSRKRKRARGGDDLEDDFMVEDEGGLGAGLEGEEGSEEEEDEEESEEEDGEEEESDVEDGEVEARGRHRAAATEDDSVDEKEDEEEPIAKRRRTTPTKAKELPFTFPCPSTHDEFLEIIEDVTDEDIPTVVQRIRALYHPSLGVDNKVKLQTFIGVLIDHVLYAAAPPTPRFTLVSALAPHIYALTKTYPIQSGEHFVAKLSLMNKNLKRGLARGASNPDSRTWPGLPELALLRTIGAIWPTSDMNHAVISPTRLLMSSYLGLCRVRSLQDLACGLFICTLFLQFEHLSKRFVPEVVNFLVNAVLHLAPHRYDDAASIPGSFPSPDFKSEACQKLTIDVKAAAKMTVRPSALDKLLASSDGSTQDKVNLLGLTVDLLSRSAQQYKDLDAFIELYQPILDLLQNVKVSKLSKDLQTRLKSTTDALGRLLKFSRQARQPLRLQAHKPIPIPSYIPKFEATQSSYLRAQDADHEAIQASKLRREYKQERKGAIRELRKDARFLAGVEQEKQREKDAAYSLNLKRAYGSIEGERAEEKAMERDKAREKRRAGRK
ncbi:Nop14-like protein [Peniophora sp. CONT]|nr:Nop14-like protein [Peniophora sp. CONT]